MPCEISDRDRRIDDFLMNQLTPADAEAFEIHLFGCKECLAELRLREQMMEILAEERVTAASIEAVRQTNVPRRGLLPFRFDFWHMLQNAWIYAGAVAIIVVFVVITRFDQKDSACLDMAAFAESPHLESALQQTYRTAKTGVKALSPAPGENFTGEIVFRWEVQGREADSNRALALKILDNQENLIHAASAENGHYPFKENLAPGLYYWTLEEQGETLYVGKFFVNKPDH